MMRKTFTTEQLVDRWEDQRDIKNLMGKYINYTLQNRDDEIFAALWSSAADVCLGFNDGWYVGTDAVAGYYAAMCACHVLVADVLQKHFPEKLGGKTPSEIFGIGTFRVFPIVNPIVKIAADGKTAKGLWYAQGSQALVTPAGPTSHWTFGYFAADFIREGDDWKLWHLQFTNDLDTRCGYDWGQPAEEMPEIEQFAALKDFQLPPYSVDAEVRAYYTPRRPLTGAPRLPEDYDTFADTFSYGI